MPATITGSDHLDPIWSRAVGELLQIAIAEATACTETIFKLASLYLRREAFEALSKFYELYFDQTHDAKKTAVNAEVDEIFEAALASLNQDDHHQPSSEHIHEDQESKRLRLAMAALQKQLEGLIVLDSGIRDEIVPALSSMQFEDSLRQRLNLVAAGWKTMIEQKSQILQEGSAVSLARDLAKRTSSVQETELYCRHVLDEDAPAEVAQGQTAGSIMLF